MSNNSIFVNEVEGKVAHGRNEREAENRLLRSDLRACHCVIDRQQEEVGRLRAELAAERERCARIAETFPGVFIGLSAARKIAAAIRKGE